MDLAGMIEAGSANPLLLFLFALALGALHGLEPGHSKTMMAAYIVAVQGTVKQAVLLGVSAAFSHSIIVWVLAIAALTVGDALIGERLEPWFMVASGVVVLGVAGWMLWQAMRAQAHGHAHGHGHGHDHVHAQDHAHHHHGGPAHAHAHADGHHRHHAHDHAAPSVAAPGLDDAHLDAHARAHAADIRARLADGRTGTWQTILFGLSGGLIPCPAAITIFILCLNLGQLTLGLVLVGAFSTGLAATLVAIGIVAAIGLRALSARTARLDAILAAAPWLSAALIAVIGLAIIWAGIGHLQHGHIH